MENSGLFSLIIVSYRNLSGIYPTLDSAFFQTYSPIEIIIADDGTPGFNEVKHDLSEYIESNKSSNITNVVIRGAKLNRGTVANINEALAIAEGEFIKVLAAEDCFAKPTAVEEYVAFLENYDYKICFAKMEGITPDGQVRKHLLACESDYETLSNYSPEQMEQRLFARNCLPAPAWCAKRSLFEMAGLFPSCVRLIEDYPYWLMLSHKGIKFGFIDDVLVYYRLSGVSSAGDYSESFMEDMFTIYDTYIFPFDYRYGFLQPFYNALKRTGLNYYMFKATRDRFSVPKRIAGQIKYLPFSVYTYLLEKRNR